MVLLGPLSIALINSAIGATHNAIVKARDNSAVRAIEATQNGAIEAIYSAVIKATDNRASMLRIAVLSKGQSYTQQNRSL
jgi:hypothetical protein